MVTFESEDIATQVYERRHQLAYTRDLFNVYIMKDLPRSDRGGSRWASNIANESARSSGPANVQTTSAAGNSGTASAAINSARPETQNNLAEAAVPTSRAAVSSPNYPFI